MRRSAAALCVVVDIYPRPRNHPRSIVPHHKVAVLPSRRRCHGNRVMDAVGRLQRDRATLTVM